MARIRGTSGNNALNGTAGDDVINGLAGADIMTGLAGNDSYYVDNGGDQVIEAVGGGTDTVRSSVSYTLAAGEEIESLRAISAAGLVLTGNEFDNSLTGGAGNDTLVGGGGNDKLNGGAGADTLSGGIGNDSYYVDNAGDVVNEAVGGGTDTVFSSVNFTMAAGQEIEWLRAYGVGATAGLLLRGNELDNRLYGGSGNDTLVGGSAGTDRLYGGDGNDSIETMGAKAIIDAGAGDDSILLNGASTSTGTVTGGDGHDTIHSADLGQFVLDTVETLDTYYGFVNGSVAQFGSFDNYVASLAGPDMQIEFSLRGAGGTLDFTGGIGGQNSVQIRDSGLTSAINVTGSANDDLMFGTSFNDTFRGRNGNDTLIGGDGNDTLSGGAGNDLLYGGAGVDKLIGGIGNDTFVFDTSIAAGTNIDLVTDFTSGADTIRLDRNIFQGFDPGALTAAQFTSGPATGADPQIVYDNSTGTLFYDSNGAADGGASAVATLTGKPTLSASDFTVV